MYRSYFNSIKVRLEPRPSARPERAPPLFQFHKGTIRTAFSHRCRDESRRFQFHKGTIRTRHSDKSIIYNLHFNSIKVRLELIVLKKEGMLLDDFNSIKVRLERSTFIITASSTRFQFHKGTIRTRYANGKAVSLF